MSRVWTRSGGSFHGRTHRLFSPLGGNDMQACVYPLPDWCCAAMPKRTAHKSRYAVSTMCRFLDISRSWFYSFFATQPSREQRFADRDAGDRELLPKIKGFFNARKTRYGAKRIHEDLIETGEIVGDRFRAPCGAHYEGKLN